LSAAAGEAARVRPDPGIRTPTVLISVGEASGDHAAAGLVREALARRPEVRFFGLAGPEMVREGVEPLVASAEVAVVGIQEVVGRLPRIWKAWRTLSGAMATRRPDLVLLVDYPDFNLRLARRARRLGIPVLYFVSPQVWAWRAGRIEMIGRRVNRMMVLFRFEEELYRAKGIPVEWVGHPLAGGPPPLSRAVSRVRLGLPPEARVIALLPGSRRGETDRILPVLRDAAILLAREDPGIRFLLPAAPMLDPGELRAGCAGSPVEIVAGDLPAVLGASDAAAVASGTATLQVALAGVPMVIVYRVGGLTAMIARRLIRVRDVGLANLVAGRRVAEELVQEACTPARVAGALRWLLEPEAAESARRGLALVRERLGEEGAFRRAAAVTLGMIEGTVAGPGDFSV